MSEHDLQIALDGVIHLLARSLYASPDVFVRELVQNAHDAIVKRRLSTPGDWGDIHIFVDGADVVFEDDGVGLDEAQIHAHLATIGRSGTREVRESLRSHRQAVTLIGQFGIGLLSAFIVASEVTVETRAEGQPAWVWRSGGGRSYRVEPGTREEVGSTVRVTLKPEHAGYRSLEKIRGLVRRYADLLQIPIRVGAELDPVNQRIAPWDRVFVSPEAEIQATRRWWSRRFNGPPALVTRLDLQVETPDGPARLAGLIGLPNREQIADMELDVYISSMFVTSRNRWILPSWAGPFGGAITCDALTPNAARDDVMADAARLAVRDALEEALLAWLEGLARDDEPALIGALRLHAQRLLPLLVECVSDDLLARVTPHVPMPTDAGPRRVAEVLAASPMGPDGRRQVHAFTDWGNASQYLTLCAARGLPVLDLSGQGAHELLQRYAALTGFEIVRVDLAGLSSLFAPLGLEERLRFRGLLVVAEEVLAGRGVRVEVARFAPSTLPAVRVDTAEGRQKRVMAALADDGGVPAELRDLLAAATLPAESPRATLYLNADNPLVLELVERCHRRDASTTSSLRLLYVTALLLSGQRLAAAELGSLFHDLHEAVDLILEIP